MKTKWKIVLGVIIIIAAAAFLIPQVMRGVEVAVEEVVPRDMAISFTEEGEVVPLRERALHPLYSAPLKSLMVEEGDKVREGDLLALLDHEELEYMERELMAQFQALEGEKMQLEETPGPAEVESYALRVREAEESLATAQRNYERLEDLYLDSYLLRVEEAEESLEAASREYERMKALHEEGYLPTAEYDKTRDQLKKAENYLAQQEHALEVFEEDEYDKARDMVTKAEISVDMQRTALEVLRESYDPPRGSREIIEARKKAILAQVDLVDYQKSNYSITAPISGVVTYLEVEEGDLVTPQVPMMKLFQEEELQVESRVLTRDVHEVYEGMPVKLTLELREEDVEFPGEVVKISPHAQADISPLGLEEERVKVTIKPQIPEDLTIAPGYKVDVEYIAEEVLNKLIVPKSALFTYEGEDALMVIENGRARLRRVTRGPETRLEVVIEEGLEEGDQVILDPQREGIDEGVAVTPL